MSDYLYIVEGVTVAQPFSPLLSRYGLERREQLPPHGAGQGPCDITINASKGRVECIEPSAAPPFPAGAPSSFSDVPLLASSQSSPAGSGGPKRFSFPHCFAFPGLLDSSQHALGGLLDSSGRQTGWSCQSWDCTFQHRMVCKKRLRPRLASGSMYQADTECSLHHQKRSRCPQGSTLQTRRQRRGLLRMGCRRWRRECCTSWAGTARMS